MGRYLVASEAAGAARIPAADDPCGMQAVAVPVAVGGVAVDAALSGGAATDVAVGDAAIGTAQDSQVRYRQCVSLCHSPSAHLPAYGQQLAARQADRRAVHERRQDQPQVGGDA